MKTSPPTQSTPPLCAPTITRTPPLEDNQTSSCSDTFSNSARGKGLSSVQSPNLAQPEANRTISIQSDAAIYALFQEGGTNLVDLWETFALWLEDSGLQVDILKLADQNAACPSSGPLPARVRAAIGKQLAILRTEVLATAGIRPELKKTVGRYFSIKSYEARLLKGDQYMLSSPATPVRIISEESGTRFESFETLSQSSGAFAVINPESDLACEPEVEDPYGWVKKLFINYLLISGTIFKEVEKFQALTPPHAPAEPTGPTEGSWLFGPSATTKDTQVRGKEALRDLDNRRFMRPELDDQGRHGYCWSFAGTRLAEEQVCKNDPDSAACHSALSPLDASARSWRFAEEQEGGFIDEAISTTIKQGVCLNKDAFYPNAEQEREIVGHLNRYFIALRDGADPVNDATWETLQVSPNNATVTFDPALLQAARTVHQQSQSWWRFWQWPLQWRIWSSPLGSNFKRAMGTLSAGDEHVSLSLRDTLIGAGCRDHRITAPFAQLKEVTHTFNYWDRERAPKLEVLKEALGHGNSLGVGMCVAKQMGRGGCGPHAIVLDGMRYNTTDDKWEAHFINSWGNETTVMNGWKDLGDVVDDFLAISYYEPNTSQKEDFRVKVSVGL